MGIFVEKNWDMDSIVTAVKKTTAAIGLTKAL